ncbi:uncharacterized protein LOC127288470 [Leptopilina boulardi]|uniref:uncharacterized protein LOC127288470 n=1 Tax=Leptopilina boulardi TaxID=63433 RepID=UPI0021F54B5E|nr:uncharacterized protein LOC127288470 [Leptopilina boulardi]
MAKMNSSDELKSQISEIIEQVKSQILKVIENFTSESLKESDNKQLLIKSEIRNLLIEILNNFSEDEIITNTIDSETELKLENYEEHHNQTNILNKGNNIADDIEGLLNKSVETCRNVDVDVNTTSIIESTLDLPDGLNSKNTTTPISPAVLLNDIGRTDTFEIKSPNNDSYVIPSTIESNENFPNSKIIQKFMKKLDNHQNKLSTMCTEFMDMKMQFQKDVNQNCLSEKSKIKSPSLTITPLKRNSTLNITPKLGTSSRRSISFSSVSVRKSSNLTANTTILAAREKIRKGYEMKKDDKNTNSIPKNPKYANVQSTIPKPTPKRK